MNRRGESEREREISIRMKSQNSGAKWWEMGDKRDVPRGFVIGQDVNETWPYRERFADPFFVGGEGNSLPARPGG